MAQKIDDSQADLWASNKNEPAELSMTELEEMKSKKIKKEKSEDENSVRGNWSNKAEFILSSLGYAVGLGNVVRFPYLCFKNGGATFLVPYATMLLVAGLPIFYLDMSLGQFSSLGCVSLWRCAPLFKGLGWAMLAVSALVSIYYNVIMSWAIYYLFASFSDLPSLPWVGCKNEWNTDSCFDERDYNSTVNTTALRMMNPNATSPAAEYFMNAVLQVSPSIEETGTIHWYRALSLLLAWLLVYCCIIRGIKSAGKVVYFTATVPYLLILVLLIRGVTLEGAEIGIRYYIVDVDWDKLRDPAVWQQAAGQIFYSLSAATGGLHTIASYNKFHNNLFTDAVAIALMNCLTSIFAGFAVFSILGHMAFQVGKDIREVGDASGAGLAFIAYPEALSRLPIGPFWSVLFFFTLIILAIDSMYVLVETVVTAAMDEFRYLSLRRRVMKWIVPVVYCTAAFLLGFPLISQAGLHWVGLIDDYSANIPLVIIGLLECLVITYVYGLHHYYSDMKVMLGKQDSLPHWVAFWCIVLLPLIIAPIALGLVVVLYAWKYEPSTAYPEWAIVLGWLITSASLACIVFYIPYYLFTEGQGSFTSRLKRSLRPTPDWGPALNQFREEANYKLFPTISEKGVVNFYPKPGAEYLYTESVSQGVQCNLGNGNDAYEGESQ